MSVAEVTDRAVPVRPSPRRRRVTMADLLVLGVAAAVACSPLAYGYYALTAWAPLGLCALTLLVAIVLRSGPVLGIEARASAAGLALLVGLSFASLIWAQSRDSAWTSANQFGVYAVVFAIGLLAIRSHATSWAVMVLLGLPALVTAAVLAVELVAGGAGGAFIASRLDAPMGYVNGTAALLVMGAWPWLGLAERLPRRGAPRAAMLAAAALVASTAALTQTRAILLASAVSIVLALLAAPGRARRCLNLLIVLGAVAAAAPWTLRVYSSTGPTHLGPPHAVVLRGAGLATLGAAVMAAALELLGQTIWRRTPLQGRELGRRLIAGRRSGAAALALLAAALIVGGIAERSRIAAQWHDFTTLKEERSAGDRFLALGSGPRYDLWRIAIDEFATAPLGGVGAGNYATQEYRRRRALEHASNPHSVELQMLAELGAGGGLALLLFVVPVLGAGLGGAGLGGAGLGGKGLHGRRRLLTATDPALRVAALGVFSAWLAGASVDWLDQIPGLTAMAMLAAATLLAPAAHTAPAGPAARKAAARAASGTRSRPVIAAGLVAVGLLAASIGRQYGAVLYGDAGNSLVRSNPPGALRALRTAEQLDPWSTRTLYEVAAAYARLDDYAGARAALRRAERLEPESYVPPALLGDIARRTGHRAAALADYRRALRLDPLEPALKRAIDEVSR